MSYTATLASYAATLRYQDIPASAVAAAKRVTLDYLGVTLAAIRYAPGTLIVEYVRGLGGHPRSTVIGTDLLTSPCQAALANGTLAADMEQDDVHPSSNLHASSVFHSAALPVAEVSGADGKAFLAAVVAAYDVGCRVSRAMGDGNQYARGFHPTAVSGTFGAAAAAGKLLGLDGPGMASAIGLTGCQAAGLLTWEQEQEHFTKSFQSGVPARNAVTAAELARMGYVGAPDTLDGKYNVFDAFAGQRNFPALVADLGSRFEVEHTGYKFYSCCRMTHSTLDAVLSLARQHRFGPSDIDSITVWLAETAAPIVDNNDLTTHNLQHVVAAALTDGTVMREQTSAARRQDPALRALAGRVTLLSDPALESLYPEHWAARVRIRTTKGAEHQLQLDDPFGTDARPASDEEIQAKFRRMAGTVLPADRVEQLIDTVNRLETLSTIRPLTGLLAVNPRS